MIDKLKEHWDEAGKTGEPVDIGRIVVCDCCCEDYTDSTEHGGFIFGSSGYCPTCAVKSMPSIIGYNEQKYIRATCPQGISFADFIRAYRGPEGNKIQVRSGPKKASE